MYFLQTRTFSNINPIQPYTSASQAVSVNSAKGYTYTYTCRCIHYIYIYLFIYLYISLSLFMSIYISILKILNSYLNLQFLVQHNRVQSSFLPFHSSTPCCSHPTLALIPWATAAPCHPHIDVDACLPWSHLMVLVLNIQEKKGREEQGEM